MLPRYSFTHEDYFFCFGCGASGDVIDFTARLFGISPKDATEKLAADFGISAETKRVFIRQNPSRLEELRCRRALTAYLHLLKKWKTQYAPKTPEDSLDDRFVESCQQYDRIAGLLEMLDEARPTQRSHTVSALTADGREGVVAENRKEAGYQKMRGMSYQEVLRTNGQISFPEVLRQHNRF